MHANFRRPTRAMVLAATVLIGLSASVTALRAHDRGTADVLVVRVTTVWQSLAAGERLHVAVEHEVSAVWRRHGVSILWGTEGEEDAAPASVTLVITDEGPREVSGWNRNLGWMRFGAGGEPQNVLWVSAPNAIALAAEARAGGRPVGELPARMAAGFTARMIGRAAAHELGHYLLATPRHSRHGLMRPTFQPWEAGSTETGLSSLDPSQLAALRTRFATRAGAHPAPNNSGSQRWLEPVADSHEIRR
jgi:hypothetical protein